MTSAQAKIPSLPRMCPRMVWPPLDSPPRRAWCSTIADAIHLKPTGVSKHFSPKTAASRSSRCVAASSASTWCLPSRTSPSRSSDGCATRSVRGCVSAYAAQNLPGGRKNKSLHSAVCLEIDSPHLGASPFHARSFGASRVPLRGTLVEILLSLRSLP
jgi:hypothetical protein